MPLPKRKITLREFLKKEWRPLLQIPVAIAVIIGTFYISKYFTTSNPSKEKPTNENSNYANNKSTINNTIHIQSPPPKESILAKSGLNRTKATNADAQTKSIAQQPQIYAPNGVVSIGQQNGITAHTVNIGQPERHITPEQRSIILGIIQHCEIPLITLSYSASSSEKRNFAEELIATFIAAGCKLNINKAQVFISAYGSDSLIFAINKESPYMNSFNKLHQAFQEAKIDAKFGYGLPNMKPDSIVVDIGDR